MLRADLGRALLLATLSLSFVLGACIVGYAGCTRMACPEMAVEDALLKALDATVRWSISGDDLALLGQDGAAVARFKARNL